MELCFLGDIGREDRRVGNARKLFKKKCAGLSLTFFIIQQIYYRYFFGYIHHDSGFCEVNLRCLFNKNKIKFSHVITMGLLHTR